MTIKLKDQQKIKLLSSEKTIEKVKTESLKEGQEKGIEKGLLRGIEKGEQEKAIKIAKGMKSDDEPVEKITKYTRLTKEEIEVLS